MKGNMGQILAIRASYAFCTAVQFPSGSTTRFRLAVIAKQLASWASQASRQGRLGWLFSLLAESAGCTNKQTQ